MSNTVLLALNCTFSETDLFNLAKSRVELSPGIHWRTESQGGEKIAEVGQLLAYEHTE